MADEKNPNEKLTASRARNRTVMLTPEITGEVRARLAKEGQKEIEAETPPNQGMPSGIRSSSRRSSGTVSNVQSPHPPPFTDQEINQGSGVFWAKETKVVGFLVSYDNNENGDFYELRVGRLIVSSEPAGTGSCLIIEDDTVSPMHAIIRIGSDRKIQVLDQLSEYGTVISKVDSNEDIELSGDKAEINHGDVISFGQRRFYVCLVPAEV